MNEFFTGLVGRATQRVPVLERRPRSRFEPVARRGPAIELDGAAPAAAEDLGGVTDGAGGESLGARRRDPVARRASARVPALEGAAAQSLGSLRSSVVQPGSVQLEGEAQTPAAAFVARPEEADLPEASEGESKDESKQSDGLDPAARLEPAFASRSMPPAAIPFARVDPRKPARAGAALDFAAPEPHRAMRAALAPPAVQPSSAELAAATSISRAARPASPVASGSLAAPPRFTPQAPRNVDGQPAGPAMPGAPGSLAHAVSALLAPRVTSPLAQAGPATIGRDRGPRPNGPAVSAPAPVHVTIGRIEVRATAPAADRPIRRAPPQPRLSLEDYLSGRRGGAR